MSETTTEETAAVEGEEPKPDAEEIVPPGTEITIDGVPCRIRRLKTREFLSLMQVLTRGLGSALGQVRIDLTDSEEVASQLSALMLLAVPNAVDEFTVFLRDVVEPKDEEHRARVATYLLDNPDVEVLLDVFERIAVQEREDLAVLAGKAQAMWSRLAPMYQRRTT